MFRSRIIERNHENVKKVCQVIHLDRQSMNDNTCNISDHIIHQCILTEDLNMRCTAAEFVPHQKQNNLSVYNDLQNEA